MSQRSQPSNERTPAERLAAIDERQLRLLSELDRLNERIEAALGEYGTTPAAEQPV